MFLLAEICPGTQGLPHTLSLLSCHRLCSKRSGCRVFTGTLGTLADGYRREPVFSLFLKKRSFLKCSFLDTNGKCIIHPHGHWTLQTPKRKALFKIRKHFQTQDQSWFVFLPSKNGSRLLLSFKNVNTGKFPNGTFSSLQVCPS